MKITALTQQKNKAFYNLFVDEKFLCSLDDELILIHNLFHGKEIDAEYIVEITKEAAYKKSFNIALRYLSYKMRTQKEIENYLLDKEFDREIIFATIEKLKYYKYVDDENYILLYIKSKITEGYSKRKIQYNLVNKGLDEENVLLQLNLNYPKDLELLHLTDQVVKLNKKYKQLPYRDRVSKIYQSLIRKGYNHDDINEVITRNISRENSQSVEFVKRLEKLYTNYMGKFIKKGYNVKEARFKTTQAMYRKGYDIEVINKCFMLEE